MHRVYRAFVPERMVHVTLDVTSTASVESGDGTSPSAEVLI